MTLANRSALPQCLWISRDLHPPLAVDDEVAPEEVEEALPPLQSRGRRADALEQDRLDLFKEDPLRGPLKGCTQSSRIALIP